jgi:hypothetical protein
LFLFLASIAREIPNLVAIVVSFSTNYDNERVLVATCLLIL